MSMTGRVTAPRAGACRKVNLLHPPKSSATSDMLSCLVFAAAFSLQPLRPAAPRAGAPLAPRDVVQFRRHAPPLAEEVNPGAVEGTDLLVLEYPHPQLRAPNADVLEFDEALRKLTKEMFSIMYASRGVGLAAPQLGINKRLMVFNPEGNPKKWTSEVVLCNPSITEYSAATDVEEEGCLSFPGFTADVRRSKWIKVEWTNVRGKPQKKKLNGWEARIFQVNHTHATHEIPQRRRAREPRPPAPRRRADALPRPRVSARVRPPGRHPLRRSARREGEGEGAARARQARHRARLGARARALSTL